jgi:hypothetical protein
MKVDNNTQRKIQAKWVLLVWILVVILLLSGCATANTPKVYRVGILSGLFWFDSTADGFNCSFAHF